MFYSPDYTIQLPQGKQIPLLFNTWTYKKFTLGLGIELEDFIARLNPDENGNRKPLIKFSEYPQFFLCAAESFCKYNNQPFTHSDLDSCVWMDTLGGYTSEKLVELTLIAVGRLANTDPSNLEAKPVKGSAKPAKKK